MVWRARRPAYVAGELAAGALTPVQASREAINREVLCAEIFVGKRSPLSFDELEKWLAPPELTCRVPRSVREMDVAVIQNVSHFQIDVL